MTTISPGALLSARPVWRGPEFYAHTPSRDGSGRWHSFVDHARGTATLAFKFGSIFGAGELLRLIALTHDAGKLTEDVQVRLRQRAIDGKAALGAPHKYEGAALGYLMLAPEATDVSAARLIAQANAGHHSGIPALGREPDDLLGSMLRDPAKLDPLIDLMQSLLGCNLRELARQIHLPDFVGKDVDGRPYRLELLTRMCHSALVDADFLDTAAHFTGSTPRRQEVFGMIALRDAFMDSYSRRFGQASGALNELRRTVFEQCVANGVDREAAASRRIYRLPAQTGSGKTMAAAAFALHHAAAFGKRRLIVAVPYTSITTQNAEAYRKCFQGLSGEVVLEHHSNIIDPSIADVDWRRLSAENWDAEFIVTTTVQLFESLFSNKPAATRKLHRIASSVIVIDEVQALPLRLVPSILRMLRELVECFDVTVLLASATQPSFWRLPIWENGFDPIDISDIDEVPAATRRVVFEIRQTEQSWESVAEEVSREPQALVIVNTTRDAQSFHEMLAEMSDGAAMHLSTRMCGQHRLDVLTEVRRRLTVGAPVRLVSTQLIEAGVDVDFPVVYRALAPADSIVQSAGRCNREGRLGIEGGRVIVFQPSDGGSIPGAYEDLTGLTRVMFVERSNEYAFGDPKAMDAYYLKVWARHHGPGVLTTSGAVDQARRERNFPETRRLFRMIEDEPLTVLVCDYGEGDDRRAVAELVSALEDPSYVMKRADHRLVHRFSARLPKGLATAEPVVRVGGASSGIHLWGGEYDGSRGVVIGAAGLTI